jgi:hypothetical protein
VLLFNFSDWTGWSNRVNRKSAIKLILYSLFFNIVWNVETTANSQIGNVEFQTYELVLGILHAKSHALPN